jgi:hypothetical protein
MICLKVETGMIRYRSLLENSVRAPVGDPEPCQRNASSHGPPSQRAVLAQLVLLTGGSNGFRRSPKRTAASAPFRRVTGLSSGRSMPVLARRQLEAPGTRWQILFVGFKRSIHVQSHPRQIMISAHEKLGMRSASMTLLPLCSDTPRRR